tara:strand:- start:1942 stop:2310 length:369 start_codon:yes stop_codon:yes gene_type:complete
MEKIQSGNLNKKNNTRGWCIGHFMENPPFKNTDFEVKWGKHPKGEKKSHPAKNKTAKTLSILIQGKFALQFKDKELVMESVGDYVFWDANIPHSWTTLEDAIILTIRWPSVPNDQIPEQTHL